ncbi:MAG: sterol desaturase family protein [Steroidobacteraceae bacterium]
MNIDTTDLARPLLATGMLAALWIIEAHAPMFPGHHNRLSHAARNVAMASINTALTAVFFAGLLLAASRWASSEQLGLLHAIPLPGWARTLLAFALIDLWQYFWHRLNHGIPLLWRFHAVHHSDGELDASSGIRFHAGEIAFSALARLALIPVLGLSVVDIALYDLITTPIVLFHHGNIRLPSGADRVLRAVIVTPRMHWVHHSRLRVETDSNFASGFSGWDRIFGTFRLRSDPRTLELGLDGFDRCRSQTLAGMLASPARRSMDRLRCRS